MPRTEICGWSIFGLPIPFSQLRLDDPKVDGIDDVDAAGGVGGDVVDSVELSLAVAELAPVRQEATARRELLDRVVAGVGDVDLWSAAEGIVIRATR